eukprot:scaffold6572_cov106-Cylindrotheca_fusiformis.AAC.11
MILCICLFSTCTLFALSASAGALGVVPCIGGSSQNAATTCSLFHNRESCTRGDVTLIPKGPLTTWSRLAMINLRGKGAENLCRREMLLKQNPYFELDPCDSNNEDSETDTKRIRIWKALVVANGKEMSLKQLGMMISERSMGDLRSHLTHVERQARTFGNKSDEWKKRRGLVKKNPDGTDVPIQKLRLRRRRGERGTTLVKLEI